MVSGMPRIGDRNANQAAAPISPSATSSVENKSGGTIRRSPPRTPRAAAARGVRGGDRRMVPPLLFSTLLVALGLIGAAAWFAFRSPILGIPLTIAAVVVGGVWLRVSLDTARHAG